MIPTTLTKSRFKVAIECPTKLAYSGDDRYVSAKRDDEFLEALADGGHKVGALAQRMYPGGIEITADSIARQLEDTSELLKRESVTLFEPTIQFGNCLVRVDILVKRGKDVQLIEVKSKGFKAGKDSFRGKQGSVTSDWKSYLYDVAFQWRVVQQAYPDWKITPYLMLLDTGAAASLAGVGAMFKVDRVGRKVRITIDPQFDISGLTQPLLRVHEVSAEVDSLIKSPVATPAGLYTFDHLVEQLGAELAAGRAFPPVAGSACRSCEFYCSSEEASETRRSGWAECMAQALQLPARASREDTVFALYSHRKVEDLLRAGRRYLVDLTDDDLPLARKEEEGKISLSERHRLQVREARGELQGAWINRVALREAFQSWRFPLHFIDFETARPSLPYQQGFTPNQQLLFQFSHHVLTGREQLRHQSQFLSTRPAEAPSIPTVRALRAELGGAVGTVVHWWVHERLVLNDLARQIEASDVSDKQQLLEFIHDLVGEDGRPGRLADLGRLVANHTYFPGTGGSSSIKKILPAILGSSGYLSTRYGRPIYGTAEMPSLNFESGWTWYQEKNGRVLDPYELLAPVLQDAAVNTALRSVSDDESGPPEFVANGGAAMVAYGTLQNPQLAGAERSHIERQLKRYCELDTLAMVMVYEHLTAELARGS